MRFAFQDSIRLVPCALAAWAILSIGSLNAQQMQPLRQARPSPTPSMGGSMPQSATTSGSGSATPNVISGAAPPPSAAEEATRKGNPAFIHPGNASAFGNKKASVDLLTRNSSLNKQGSNFMQQQMTKNYDKAFKLPESIMGKSATIDKKMISMKALPAPSYLTQPKSPYSVGEGAKMADVNKKAEGFDKKSSFAGLPNLPEGNKYLPSKSYNGPEVALIRRDLMAVNKAYGSMDHPPDRSISIDEVRNLLKSDISARDVRGIPAPLATYRDDGKPVSNVSSQGAQKSGLSPGPLQRTLPPAQPIDVRPVTPSELPLPR